MELSWNLKVLLRGTTVMALYCQTPWRIQQLSKSRHPPGLTFVDCCSQTHRIGDSRVHTCIHSCEEITQHVSNSACAIFMAEKHWKCLKAFSQKNHRSYTWRQAATCVSLLVMTDTLVSFPYRADADKNNKCTCAHLSVVRHIVDALLSSVSDKPLSDCASDQQEAGLKLTVQHFALISTAH